MARRCAKRGHEAIVFANDGGLVSAKSVKSDNVEYIFVPTGFNRLLNKLSKAGSKLVTPKEKPKGSCPLFASRWYHVAYAAEIGRRVRELGCDVVHIMNYSQFVPVIRKMHPRCRISLHMQCEWLTQLDSRLVQKRLDCTDIIIGCSEYITRKTAERFPRYADRCVTVPNAADEVPLNSGLSPDSKAVLCVNRLSPEKGIHILIRAFHQVLERFPDARLHLVGPTGSVPFEYVVGLSDDPLVISLRAFYQNGGSGSKDFYLEALEKEAGQELGKRIIFEGNIAHDQIGSYYKRAAVLVSSSVWSEPFGISLVEAMMHGVPVVASRVGGMAYTVDHGRTGLLVDPADPKALARAICEVLEDRESARRMGEAGREKAVEKFSWERAADLLLEHFEAL
ncbi:MAG TPA: glycosyltransferase family 4 protein [Chthoniobacterales bacterium]|jgi:glycosyltransferase involved in cell wall biosynthesis|nr:glycosyltransferase family 4 protein [Chthoniobacterales bacterium]